MTLDVDSKSTSHEAWVFGCEIQGVLVPMRWPVKTRKEAESQRKEHRAKYKHLGRESLKSYFIKRVTLTIRAT